MVAARVQYPDTIDNREYDMENEQPVIWIKVADAAEIMGVSISNVAYLCRNEKIRCQKWGNAWMVSKVDAENYERSNRNPTWLHEDDES